MSELLNISTNKIVNTDGTINSKSLQNIINRLNDKVKGNIFNNLDGTILELDISKSGSSQKFGHGLNFIPNFAIISYQDPSTTAVVLNYQAFTNKDISITTDSAVSLKLLVGRLDE